MKKSFILHIDSLCVLDELSDEQAGKLFKAIRDYHNNKESDLDFSLKLAFAPFKNQFIRDLEKYKNRSEINASNGKLGGRGNKSEKSDSLYLNQTKPKKAKKADSDSDSDSDNDNETTIVVIEQNEILPNTEFFKFNKWLKENAPNVCKIKTQISETEFNTLKSKYPPKRIADIILQMENYKGIEKKYTSVYLTLNNWIKNDKSTSTIERNNDAARIVAERLVGGTDF